MTGDSIKASIVKPSGRAARCSSERSSTTRTLLRRELWEGRFGPSSSDKSYVRRTGAIVSPARRGERRRSDSGTYGLGARGFGGAFFLISFKGPLP